MKRAGKELTSHHRPQAAIGKIWVEDKGTRKRQHVTQSLNYIGLIGVLVKEIQDLKRRVKTLENT